MKTEVDIETCIGCGLCAQMAPEVYDMYEDKAYSKVDEVPCNKVEEAKDACDQCPVDAISII